MAYQPPKQSFFAQIVDVAVLLVLTVGALYLPLYLGLAGAAKVPNPIENPTWEALGQNAIEQQQWAALGIARESEMDIWNLLEYAAWALSLMFGALMLADVIRIDTTYDNDLLTSSREGEIEATQERHTI